MIVSVRCMNGNEKLNIVMLDCLHKRVSVCVCECLDL